MNVFKVMNDDEIRDFCIKKDFKIFELEKQLQQKENIIKEVREYIESFKKIYEGYYPYIDTRHLDLNKLLEMLGSDKE